jgi:hypothetical protein
MNLFEIDWTNLELYHYLAIGGGAVALLALLLALLMPRIKVPGAILATIGALIAGVAVGVIGMAAFGYQTQKRDDDDGGAAVPNLPPGPAGGMGDMMAKMKGMAGGKGGKGFGKGKGKGPSPKTQLADLVTKLHQLTDKPLKLTFSDEQTVLIRAELKGLSNLEELADDDAEKRLRAILAVVDRDRPVLEAAGYRWPDTPFQFPPPPPPNPFKEGTAHDHLLSLEDALATKKK